MVDTTYKTLAESILVAHQRIADYNCLCGELELGDSWVIHVTSILDMAGALRREPPKKEV